jgi:peptidoglycan/LPS O-acetylase OafA/YrhL
MRIALHASVGDQLKGYRVEHMNFNEERQTHSIAKEVSVCLKGIFALMVLLHHFQQRTAIIAHPLLGKCFELLGFLSVSVFLFFSGFGLVFSYEKKGELYLENFARSRILSLYCINVFLILLSLIKNVVIGVKVTLADVLSSMLFSGTIITYGWYIQTILLFYLLFFAFFRASKKDTTGLALTVLSVITYIAVSHFMDAAPATYISALSFVLGLILAKCSHGIQVLFKHKTIVFLLSFSIFSTLIVLSLLTDNRNVRYLYRIIASPFFTITVLTTTEIICGFKKQIIVNRITKMLGSISLEIYVAQGFLFDIFRSDLIYINNTNVYVLAVGINTFLLALLLHPIFSFIKTHSVSRK